MLRVIICIFEPHHYALILKELYTKSPNKMKTERAALVCEKSLNKMAYITFVFC